MNQLYNLAIKFYTLLIRVAALWDNKAKLWIDGRATVFEEIKRKVNPEDKKVWFHCSSLGEFEQARPVIELFKQRNPSFKILLTFFSPSGYEVRQNYPIADYVFYLPADTVVNARKFLELTKPSLAAFAKYDFWFNYLQELKRNKIPVVVFSAIFRKEQYFFKGYGSWFLKIVGGIDALYVQDETSRKLLKKSKIVNVTVAGDTRFDRVMQNAENAQRFPLLEKFRDENKITIIAGSTWSEDERLIIELIKKRKDAMKYIIAPHETDTNKIEKLIEEIELPVVLYSQADENTVSNADVLIIDNVGMLAQLYQYGDIAYIGGGFGKGIHNILEPAAFALPVIFGPNYQRFNEAKDLINQSAAFSIDKYRSLNNKISDLFFDKSKVASFKKRISQYMNSKRGATEIVVGGLEKLIATTK
jgi:3-deoxy-D-manno-octulosonic-acid transferase